MAAASSTPRQNAVPFGSLRNQHDSTDKRVYVYDDFKQPIIPLAQSGTVTSYQTTPALPTGAAGDYNLLYTGQQVMTQFIIGTQTLIFPIQAATGLDVSQDLTDNDGWEIALGGSSFTLANSRQAYTIGTSKPFFAKISFNMADVSGTDEFLFGFRKQEAPTGSAYTGYTDYFAIGIVTAANPALIKIVSRINTGTAVITDTTQTWADEATKVLEVRVGLDGKAIALLNGTTPTNPYFAHTFDSGDVVFPFLRRIYATTTPGAEVLHYYEGGYQNWIGNNPKG